MPLGLYQLSSIDKETLVLLLGLANWNVRNLHVLHSIFESILESMNEGCIVRSEQGDFVNIVPEEGSRLVPRHRP